MQSSIDVDTMSMLPLHCHSDTPCSADIGLSVTVQRAYDLLEMRYQIAGDLTALKQPPSGSGDRQDGLWTTTCFEAFVRPQEAQGYIEFNFSPSTDWAAYQFLQYRNGRSDALITPPRITVEQTQTGLNLDVSVDLSRIGWTDQNWELALTCVMETTRGDISYWSLHHADGKPDFHHPDGFVHLLAHKEAS